MKAQRSFHLPPAVCAVAALMAGAAASARGDSTPIDVNVVNSQYEENFDTLPTIGTGHTVVLPPGFHFLEAGTGANGMYITGTGSSTAGDSYSFGSAGSTDRALGELTSGTVQSTFGVSFRNNTGQPIDSFVVSYTGECWRVGTADANTDRLDFQFSTSATALNNGTWTDISARDVVTPASPNPAGAGAKDGNDPANRQVFNPINIIPNVSIPPGGLIFLRWVAVDIASNDDGLAIDDFKIKFVTIPTTITGLVSRPGTGLQSNMRFFTITGTAKPFSELFLDMMAGTAWVPLTSLTTDSTGEYSILGGEPLNVKGRIYRVRRPR